MTHGTPESLAFDASLSFTCPPTPILSTATFLQSHAQFPPIEDPPIPRMFRKFLRHGRRISHVEDHDPPYSLPVLAAESRHHPPHHPFRTPLIQEGPFSPVEELYKTVELPGEPVLHLAVQVLF